MRHKKLIIQIPCLNEQDTLGQTVDDIKAVIPQLEELVDEIEILIIDDGSTDNTIKVAREHGVNHVVKLPENKGLATAFQAGIEAAWRLGADYLINTDGDNQYSAQSLYSILKPIVLGEADVVVGARDIAGHEEFSFVKKKLQKLGSCTVSWAAKTRIKDTTSGFRAFAMSPVMSHGFIVHGKYSYTLETIVNFGNSSLTMVDVPIEVNRKTRDSRLFKSIPSYVKRSGVTIIKSAVTYSPIRFFGAFSVMFGLLALASALPWLSDFILTRDSSGHIQSLVVSVAFFVASIQFLGLAVVANLIKVNREMTQRTLGAVTQIERRLKVPPKYLNGDGLGLVTTKTE